MKTITEADVKARATTPEGALEVSIEKWRQRAEASADSLLTGYRGEWAPSSELCGLCAYYTCKGGCRSCPITTKGSSSYSCTAEYHEAVNLYDDFFEGDVTIAELRAAFWKMVARLESARKDLPKSEPKPKEREIRHGELVQCAKGARIYVAMEQTPSSDKWNIWGDGYINGKVSKGDNYYKSIGINIFDDLAALQGDVTRFEVRSTHSSGRYSGILEAVICPSSANANLFFSMDQEALSGTFELPDLKEISLKLRQLIATMERKQCSKP